MNGVFKGILIGAAIMYVLLPTDFMSGVPIDDFIILLLGYISQRKVAA